MTLRHTLACCICAVLCCPPAIADVGGRPSLTAEQIVEKNIAARGGLKAWRGVESMSMTGKMDAGRLRTRPPIAVSNLRKTRLDLSKPAPEGQVVQLPFVMEMKRPLKSRLELEFRGETAIQAFDGTEGWKLRPFLGRREVESYTPEELKLASQQQALDGYLIDYAAKGTRVEPDGMEPVEGHDAYKLKLTLKDGVVRHTWIDAKTFLELKIDGTRRMDGKPREVYTYLRDYRTVEGLMVPFVYETRVDGVRDSETIAIGKVALNPPLADTRFARPE